MRLVNDQPMRESRSCSPLDELRQQRGEEAGALQDAEELRVDDDIGVRLTQQFHGLVDVRGGAGVADGNGVLERVIIPFGIEHAERKVSLRHMLSQCGRKTRFADAGAAGDQHAALVRRQEQLLAFTIHAKADPAPLRWDKFPILARKHLKQLDNSFAAFAVQRYVGVQLQSLQRICDRGGAAAKLHERGIILSVADGDNIMRRYLQIGQRRREPRPLVDACGQDHDRALVESYMKLKTKLADDLERDRFLRLPRGDNRLADRKRLDAALLQALDQACRRFPRDEALLAV